MKGGSSRVVVRRCRFENAGQRAVNIGGSTGREHFRPPLAGSDAGSHAEARAIIVEGNTFIGSLSPVAFVGADGAAVRFNTFFRPGKWIIHILQESRGPEFIPCRAGVFSDNIVVFDSRQWGEGGVNIAGGTAPETFRFARNHWLCRDDPARSRPRLPAPEESGVHGAPVDFLDADATDAGRLDLRVKPGGRPRDKGADALKP